MRLCAAVYKTVMGFEEVANLCTPVWTDHELGQVCVPLDRWTGQDRFFLARSLNITLEASNEGSKETSVHVSSPIKILCGCGTVVKQKVLYNAKCWTHLSTKTFVGRVASRFQEPFLVCKLLILR